MFPLFLPFRRIRRPQKVSLVAALFASLVLCCGLLSAFVLAPQRMYLSWRISRIPQMNAADVAAAAPGTDVLVTGFLEGNRPAEHDFVTYTLERWQVKTNADGESYGKWVDAEGYFPDLRLLVDGEAVRIQGTAEVTLLGDVHVVMDEGGTGRRLPLDAIHMADGTLRYHGLRDGDRVTVLGRKAASGGIVPSRLYAGDRAAFEEFERAGAKGLFLAGLVVMALSPLVYGLTLFLMRW